MNTQDLTQRVGIPSGTCAKFEGDTRPLKVRDREKGGGIDSQDP